MFHILEPYVSYTGTIYWNHTMESADMESYIVPEFEFTDYMSSYQFETQIQAREEHISHVKNKKTKPSKQPDSELPPSEWLYILHEYTVLGYIEYVVSDSRVNILWVASWGRSMGIRNVGSRLLERICEMYTGPFVFETRITFTRKSPAWLPGAQLNLFYKAGFNVRYWVWDDEKTLLCDMKRRNFN